MPERGRAKTLQPFAPNWSDPLVLEKTLVGRRALVDRLEELARDGAQGGALHQQLVVGPRGSGKTHVLRALYNRLIADRELSSKLQIIYLLEDELGVASFLDFVVRMLQAIVRWQPERTALAASLAELPDLPEGTRDYRAVQLLLEAIGERRALLLVENLGVIFNGKSGFGRPGQQALRDLLQQHHRIMIFATSQALVEGVRERDAPFHGFFNVTHLARLTREEALELLVAIADAGNAPDIVSRLTSAEGRGRVSAVYDFTGGNHRLLVAFYELLASESVSSLSEGFMQDLANLRPYYQEQMRGLAPQQQKIVQYLSLHRGPATVKEIARGCLTTSNVISSQLQDLLQRHVVARDALGRESYYELAEELFRIVYQADLERKGAPVRLFINFLAEYYTAQELLRRFRGCAPLASRFGGSPNTSLAGEAEFYAEAIRSRHPDLAAELSAARLGSVHDEDVQRFLGELRQTGAAGDIRHSTQQLGDNKDVYLVRTKGEAYEHLGQVAKAEQRYRHALELDGESPWALGGLACVLEAQGKEQEAEPVFAAALAHGADAGVLHNTRGEARRLRGQFAAALQDYDAALVADPKGLLPRFNKISANLGLGNVPAATALIAEAVQATRAAAQPFTQLTGSLHENCLALFEHAPEQGWAGFLQAYVAALKEAGYLRELEQALTVTVFALLREHAGLPKERFEAVVRHLREDVAGQVEVRVVIHFLEIGIEHFKNGNRKALIRLPREERLFFQRELGLDAAGEPRAGGEAD